MNKKEKRISRCLEYFDEGYACSQAIVLGFEDIFNIDTEALKLISSTFGGGMGRLRRTCGAVTGAYMVLGAKYGNTQPKDVDTKLGAYKKVRELTEQVEDTLGTSICKEILVNNATSEQVKERKYHKIICRKVVAKVAGLLYDMIEIDKTVSINCML